MQIDFVAELQARTGCGILFDISNAVVGELNGLGAVTAWFITRKTAIGRRFVAVGVNPRAAEAAGVRVLQYRIGAYVASAVCFSAAGPSGCFAALQLRSRRLRLPLEET